MNDKKIIVSKVCEFESITISQYEKNGVLKTIERYRPVKYLVDKNGVILTNEYNSELTKAIQDFPIGTEIKLTLTLN